ncbi:MAG: hypothetical protein WCG01_00100 [bacterium]
MSNHASNIKDVVLSKISKGEIKKTPKAVFVMRGALYILAITVVIAFVLFLLSFVIYALQASELWYLPMFGIKGVELLLSNFPWFLIFLALILIITLEALVSRYSFVYRKPLLYSAVGIIVIVLAVSFAVRQTAIHESIYKAIKKNNPGYAKMFYDEYTRPNSVDFHPGTVIEVIDNGFVLENRDRSTTSIKITAKTQVGKNFKIFKGGRLLVLGKVIDGVIEAEAIDNAPLGGKP